MDALPGFSVSSWAAVAPVSSESAFVALNGPERNGDPAARLWRAVEVVRVIWKS